MGFYDDIGSNPFPPYLDDSNPAQTAMPSWQPDPAVQGDQLGLRGTGHVPPASLTAPGSPMSADALKYAYEPATKLPAQGMWGNWLDNLATSLATTPLQAPNNFGGGLLSGFAKGFSTARLKNMSEREKLQKAMDDYAAKRNAANIKATADAREAREKAIRDMREAIEKRKRDREDLIFKTMLEASVKSNADGTFTLTEGEAKAMGPGYTSGQTVPKEIKVEALSRTRPDKPSAGKGSGTGQPELNDYTTLLTKVQGDNDIQKFQVVRDAWASMQKAPITGPGDISLIYSFMRINDPGSTVREGEFATAENAGGVPAQVRNLYNKILKGGRLELGVRRQFMETAQNIYRARLPQVAKATTQYRTLASKYGLDPDLVVRDYSTDDPELPREPGLNEKPPTGMVLIEAGGHRYLIDAKLKEEAVKRGGKVVG